MATDVKITVLDVNSLPARQEGEARVVEFITEENVGARIVNGSSYVVPPGAELDSLNADGRHQLFYLVRGGLVAVFNGDRHDLRAGQGVYCEPNDTCVLRNDGEEEAVFYRFLVTDTSAA